MSKLAEYSPARRVVVNEREGVLLQVQRVRFVAKIGDEQIEPPVAVRIAGRDAHAGLGAAFPVDGHARDQRLFAESRRRAGRRSLVDKEEIRNRIVAHEQADPAGALEVGRDHSQALAFRHHQTGLRRHVGKAAVAEVDVQTIVNGCELVGRAQPRRTIRHPAGAIEHVFALHVVDGKQIGQRVAIDIGHDAAGRPLRAGQTGRGRDVAERAVAVVVEQPIGADVGDEQIDETVVVEIAGRHTLAETRVANPANSVMSTNRPSPVLRYRRSR